MPMVSSVKILSDKLCQLDYSTGLRIYQPIAQVNNQSSDDGNIRIITFAHHEEPSTLGQKGIIIPRSLSCTKLTMNY